MDRGMLSRVADSFYWMSRYLERAEHTARLIDVDLQLRLDQASPEAATERWLRLLEALQIPAFLVGRVDARSFPHTLTFSRSSPSSIASCIAAARENLLQVREQCTSEMWEQLNRLYLQVIEDHMADASVLQSYSFFRAVQEGAHLFHGITDSTMSHGEGWLYIQLGQYVERTDALATLLISHFSHLPHLPDQTVEGADHLEWVGLLKGCTGFEAYCKVYTVELRPRRIAEFLLLNRDFPHSIRFSVERLHAALELVGSFTQRSAELPVRLAGRLRAMLDFSQVDEIMSSGIQGYLDEVRRQCAQVHAAIQQIYFDYPVDASMVA